MLTSTPSIEATGFQHKRVEQLLANVARELYNAGEMNMPALMKGNAGVALFFAYYYLHTREEKYLDYSIQLAEESVSWLEKIEMPAMFASGFTGIAWLVQHFTNLGLFNAETASMLDDLDGYIDKSLEHYFRNKNYDLFYGAIGNALYFRERKGRNDCAASYATIITQLQQLALHDDQGHYWKKADDPGNEINLGLAHGTTSVVNFLASAASHHPVTPELQSLLASATNWLIAQRNPPGYTSVFPNNAVTGNKTAADSRLAWCYGDLGIAYTLIKANKLLQHRGVHECISELIHSIAKRNTETSFLKFDKQLACYDNCFCHGTPGITYLLHKVYTETHDADIYHMYQEWLGITLHNMEVMLANLGKTEKRKEVINDQLVVLEDYTLLHGLPGAGLVLLALLDARLSSWDHIFLLD